MFTTTLTEGSIREALLEVRTKTEYPQEVYHVMSYLGTDDDIIAIYEDPTIRRSIKIDDCRDDSPEYQGLKLKRRAVPHGAELLEV
jgi:hypothetical protein